MLSDSARVPPNARVTDSAHPPPAWAGNADLDSSEPAIRVRNLSKHYAIYDRPQDRLKQAVLPRIGRLLGVRASPRYYRELRVLQNISFDVCKGETVGVIGRNGAGKSTLLQLLCGTLTPTAGQVEIGGRVAALLELGSGFNPEFTGRENVYLNATVLGLSRAEIDARFEAIAAFADIGEFIDMPMKTYSSGMFVRLAFAVIAHVDADCLIIDEALAVGDAFFVQKCMRFLRRFMEKGTVLFVSHDTAAVINLCHRAIWLEAGVIRAIGPPKDIVEAYLAAAYEVRQGPHAVDPAHSQASGDPSDVADPQFRNDMAPHLADPASFGKRGASIVGVELSDAGGARLNSCVGQENIVLRVRCEANDDLLCPIVGFFVKDRLGQPLFGDNSYLSYASRPLNLHAGRQFEATFQFRMPILPAGNYTVCVAVAEGTQAEHVQHHWIHDAVLFTSHSTSACTGLVGIPMLGIGMKIV